MNKTIDDLIASENFATDGAAGTVTIDAAVVDGTAPTGSSAAALNPVTFGYDFSRQAYTITANSLTQTFLPSDLVADRTNSTRVVYQKVIGGSADRLVLFEPDGVSSSEATDNTVGAGIWRHTTGASASTRIDLAAFNYGLATPGAEVPRTGNYQYNATVYGLVYRNGQPERQIAAIGGLNVDFATGSFMLPGPNTPGVESNSFTGGMKVNVNLAAEGTPGSAAGTFGGAIHYDVYNTPSDGLWTGRFYGAGARQFGGTFVIHDGALTVIGVIYGRRYR